MSEPGAEAGKRVESVAAGLWISGGGCETVESWQSSNQEDGDA